MIFSRSFRYRGCRWATLNFSSLQRFSIGIRSGDWLVHSRTLKCILLSHSLVALAVCFRIILTLRGASPDYKDSRGLTPLYHSAMVGGDPYCCELLLRDYANLGCEDENGWQEIHQACRYGHVQHLEHLLFYGADMRAQNASGNSALHLCALYNQGKHRATKRGSALSNPMFTLVTGIVGRWRAVCVTALQRPNSDAAAIRIVVGIAAASLSVTESCARVLLFRGASKEIRNFNNQTAFQVAIIAGNFELAEIIKTHKESDIGYVHTSVMLVCVGFASGDAAATHASCAPIFNMGDACVFLFVALCDTCVFFAASVGPRKRNKLHFSCVQISAKKRRMRRKTQRFCVRFGAFSFALCVASPTQRRTTQM
ncbi:unnamed protein product [Ranitomeya imitator]|uniref:Ankyrin repeat protein n=1 Tax=Ranitomeya imitator TaxID=111125 RepID=A0ABN9L0V4_9NEOB|nr:unnamed protein product [Ranitomeya imitator]